LAKESVTEQIVKDVKEVISSTKGSNFLKEGLEKKEESSLLEKTEGLPRRLKRGQMEVWYVNLEGSTERQECVEAQLKKQFIEPHRFPAVKWPKCGPNEHCFKQQYADCMQGGINWTAVSSHGTMDKGIHAVQKGVIANWCSHKRILDHLLTQNKTSDEKYYVILEDDIILSPKFHLSLENFIANYNGKWKFIQVDPFGAQGREVNYLQGRVTEPAAPGEKFPGDNYGMHCLVVKQSEIQGLLNYFTTHEVIPVDWIAQDIPGMITWAGNIAQNPEGHNGPSFAKPSFCKDGIYKSNIAGLKEHVEEEKKPEKKHEKKHEKKEEKKHEKKQ